MLAHHREHLLDVERVARRGRGDPPAQLRVERASATSQSIERLALFVAKWFEQERRRVELAAAPARPRVEQLRPRDAEQEDRRVPGEIGDVLDEVDETGSAHCKSSITTTWGRSDRPPSRSRRKASCVSGGDVPMTELRLDADRDQDLDERPVGDALAVGEAAAAQDVRRVADALEEVGDEARLPDARRAEEREEAAGGSRDGIP